MTKPIKIKQAGNRSISCDLNTGDIMLYMIRRCVKISIGNPFPANLAVQEREYEKRE